MVGGELRDYRFAIRRFQLIPKMLLFFALAAGVPGLETTAFGLQGMTSIWPGNPGALIEAHSLYTAILGGVYSVDFSSVSARLGQTQRAPAQHVGAVMAMLAVFDQARVLPPESSPKANQLIRSLIQFQSAFMNRELQSVQRYVSEALMAQLGQNGEQVYAQFAATGWTSSSMEAMVDYSAHHPFWVRPGIRDALGRYNLSPDDWKLVVEIFTQAREQFRDSGQDLHEIFADQRRSMPGGR